MAQISFTHCFGGLLGIAALTMTTSARAESESSCTPMAEPSSLFADEYARQTGADPGPRPRILLRGFDRSNVPQLRASDISQRLAGRLATDLVDMGAVVIDEPASGQRDAPAEYDLKVSGTIKSAAVNRRYQEEHTWKDDKGKRHTEPAEYLYTADVAIKLDVLDANAGDKVIFAETFRATKSRSVEAKGHEPVDYDVKLAEQALEEALQTKIASLQSRLAHQPMISDAGERDGKKLFEITAGTDSGIKPKQRVKVYRVSETTSQFSGMTDRREEFLGDAVITDHIGDTRSWIAFTGNAAQSRVCPRTLYVVKRQFDKTTVDSSVDTMRGMFSRFKDRVTGVLEQAASSPEPAEREASRSAD